MVESVRTYQAQLLDLEPVDIKPLGWETQQAAKRPKDFFQLSAREQWDIDKKLGILDWDGS